MPEVVEQSNSKTKMTDLICEYDGALVLGNQSYLSLSCKKDALNLHASDPSITIGNNQGKNVFANSVTIYQA